MKATTYRKIRVGREIAQLKRELQMRTRVITEALEGGLLERRMSSASETEKAVHLALLESLKLPVRK